MADGSATEAKGNWVRDWPTVPQVAKQLGMSEDWVRLRVGNTFRARNAGTRARKMWRVDPASVEDYLAKQ